MAADVKNYETYADVKARLDEIVEAVKDDNLPLDDVLDLYEEAVSLGLRVSDMLEDDIEDEDELEDASDELSDADAVRADASGEDDSVSSDSKNEAVADALTHAEAE